MSNPKNLTKDQQIEVLHRALNKVREQIAVISESTQLGDDHTVFQATLFAAEVIDDATRRVERPVVMLPEDDLSDIPW